MSLNPRTGNACCQGWDCVIITAPNAALAEGYRAQLKDRAKVLPRGTHFGVVPDPEGERVGNGGALLGALRYVMERENSLSGRKVLVILSSGDSRRVPQYSALGKIFSPVPRVLPDGRPSTLFDEAMESLAPVPGRIREGVLVISGDVMLSFDAASFAPGDADAAAISFPEPAAAGAGHGVFLRGSTGNIARVWHKRTPEELNAFGAVDAGGNVAIDTGAVFFSVRVAQALFSLVCEEGRCTPDSFHRVVNGHIAPSLYVDFFFPMAEEATLEGYLQEKPESAFSPELTALRRRIWQAIRPFRIRLCLFEPARFIHFGSVSEVALLMRGGMEKYRDLGWERRICSRIGCKGNPAAYNSIADASTMPEEDVYLEDSVLRGAHVGAGSIVSGTELDGQSIPAGVLVHTLPLTDGSWVTRVLGIRENPKTCPDWLARLDAENIWKPGEERILWYARLFPVCATRRESVDAALALYALLHEKRPGPLPACRRESLYSGFCRADGTAILAWRKQVRDRILAEGKDGMA